MNYLEDEKLFDVYRLERYPLGFHYICNEKGLKELLPNIAFPNETYVQESGVQERWTVTEYLLKLK